MRFLSYLAFFLLAAAPAHAGPLIAAVGGVFTALSGSAIGSFLLRTVASFALNALANALIGKPKQSNPGIRTDATTAGGSLPQTVVFGRYATGGNAVCPPMTHGTNGETVDFLTYVIDLADFPIDSLEAVFVNAEKQTFSTPGNLYGSTAAGTRFADKAWLRWYDGTQTTADPMLVEIYSAYPDRPWSADHVLTGVAYAIATFKYDADEFKGMPECLFELRGARLYDPRRDDTVGGLGTHRLADPSTWGFTENPVVMIYNILAGLPLADGSFYGLRVPASGLPLDRWVAAMNACDEEVEVWGGALEPRYRAGLEFSVDQEPLDVISTLLTACAGQVAECGGSWNVSVGPSPLPRALFTDEDIIVSNARDFQPFRGLADTYNGAHATYPAPFALWKPKDAPPFYNPTWEAADDGRRLVATMSLNAVTSGYQAQRLMREMVGDNRRMVSHTLTLRPDAMGLLPLDTVSWTSAANGYVAKLFEIAAKTLDPETLNVTLQLREREPGDYEFDYTETVPLEVLTGPWNPVDGAPETGEPEEEYNGPGGVLLPVRPGPVAADLVAVHGTSVSRSTDGGFSWLNSGSPFTGGRDISALRNAGFLVRTNDGEAWFANRPAANGWTKIPLVDMLGSEALVNGSFEDGLNGWDTVSGSPRAVESSSPPAVGGGRSILYGPDAFLLEQSISTAGLGAEMRLEGSVWVREGAAARVGLRTVGLNGNGAYASFGATGAVVAVGSSVESPFGAGLSLRLTLLETNGVVRCGGTTDYPTMGLELQSGTFARFQTEVVGADDAQYALAFRDLDGGEVLDVFGAKGYALPPGSLLAASAISDGFRLSGTAGAAPTSNNGAVHVVARGAFDFLYSAPAGRAFVLQPLPASHATTENWTTFSGTPGWKSFRVVESVGVNPAAVVLMQSLGGGRVWFDDVKLNAGAVGGALATAIATDGGGALGVDRRHLVATATTLFAVRAPGGTMEALGTLPFAPGCLAGDGDTILAAGGEEVAISVDGGETWAVHATPDAVIQVFARPAVAVLASGAVYAVATGSIALQSDLGAAHALERRRSGGDWLAVEQDSGEMQQGGLAAWTDAPAMPASVADGYRAVATDEGRVVGWRRSSRDLFNLDEGTTEWTLSPPFSQTAFDLKEVR